MAPLFTVVVATYNRPAFLMHAVSSVLEQTVKDFECLVVDDGGGSRVQLPRDARVRLITRTEMGGPSAARNTGLAEAAGRYIAFLDDDDMYTRDRLAFALEGLKRAPIAICWSRWMDAGSVRGRTLHGDVRHSILDSTTPSLGATAVARRVMQPFDERYPAVEDVEWWLRMCATNTVETVPRVGHLVRRHRGPRERHGLNARIDASLQLLRSEEEYFARHHRAAAFRWLRIGLMAHEEGRAGLARMALWRSVRTRPSPHALWHLARTEWSSWQRHNGGVRRAEDDPSCTSQGQLVHHEDSLRHQQPE